MMTADGDDSFLQSVRQIRRLFSVGVLVIVLCWSAVLPAMILWGRYNELHSLAQARMDRAAELLSSFIAAHLDTWQFQTVRVPALLADAMEPDTADWTWMELRGGGDGRVIYGAGRSHALWPVTEVASDVTDGRQVVARLTAQISMGPALMPAVFGAAVGIALSLLLLALIRLLAIRALDGALTRVADTKIRLQEQVIELERTRSELAEQLEAREADRQLLARHADTLAQANQDLTHVAQLAAHHLQEPLRTVLSFSQLLTARAKGQGDSDPDECISFIRAGTRRMQSQLSALSTYLGLRDGEGRLEQVALGTVLADLKTLLEPDLRALEAQLQWMDLPVVTANRQLMQTLFHDLVQNALTHRSGDRPPLVVVKAEADGEFWRFAVADNGLPLEVRDPERMFHLLVQDGAMGMGLAPCRRIVHMRGGRIWAEHNDGGGVVIFFTLPR